MHPRKNQATITNINHWHPRLHSTIPRLAPHGPAGRKKSQIPHLQHHSTSHRRLGRADPPRSKATRTKNEEHSLLDPRPRLRGTQLHSRRTESPRGSTGDVRAAPCSNTESITAHTQLPSSTTGTTVWSSFWATCSSGATRKATPRGAPGRNATTASTATRGPQLST